MPLSATDLKPDGTPDLCIIQLHKDLERIATYGPIPTEHAPIWCYTRMTEIMEAADDEPEPELHWEIIPIISPTTPTLIANKAWEAPRQPLSIAGIVPN